MKKHGGRKSDDLNATKVDHYNNWNHMIVNDDRGQQAAATNTTNKNKNDIKTNNNNNHHGPHRMMNLMNPYHHNHNNNENTNNKKATNIIAIEEEDDYDVDEYSRLGNDHNLLNIVEGQQWGDDVIPGPPSQQPPVQTSSKPGNLLLGSLTRRNNTGKQPTTLLNRSIGNSSGMNHSIGTSVGGTVVSGGGGGGGGGLFRNLFGGNSNQDIAGTALTTPMTKVASNNSMEIMGAPSYYPNGTATNTTMGADATNGDYPRDELQISSTEHDCLLSNGHGILASRLDLNIPTEQFQMGCKLLQACALGDTHTIEMILGASNNSNDSSTVTSTATTVAMTTTSDQYQPEQPSSQSPPKSVNVNFRDYDRRTALHVAASEGHLSICKLLIQHGARINRSDRWGGSPLDDAHRHRHKAVIDYLRSNGATTGSGNRFTNLITAAADGDIDEVRTLLRQFTNSCIVKAKFSITNKNNTNGSMTNNVSTNNNENVGMTKNMIVVNKILSELVNTGDYDKRTAMHLAAGGGHTDIVKELVNAGANINAEDKWCRRPLDDALSGNHPDTIEYIKSVGGARGSKYTKNIDSSGHYDGSSSGGNRDMNRRRENSLDSSTLKKFAYDNMHVEFNELEMIDRIGAGAFGEIYKCRWRGTLVAAKIIKTAKIRNEWVNRKIQNDMLLKNNNKSTLRKNHKIHRKSNEKLDDSIDQAMKELDEMKDAEFNNNHNKSKVNLDEKSDSGQNKKQSKQPLKSSNSTTSDDGGDDGDVDANQSLSKKSSKSVEEERDLALADFRQEISLLKSLRHPNIVLLLAYSTSQDYECIISELMKCSLLDVFKSYLVTGTRMNHRTQIVYAIQLAQGMNYLHTCKPPIIHRDLKPANLLIDHYSGVLKISDFGLSKVRPDPKQGSGTAPEKFRMTGETGYVNNIYLFL